MRLSGASGQRRWQLVAVSRWFVVIFAVVILVAVGTVLYATMNEADAAVNKQEGVGKDKEVTSDQEIDPRVLAQMPLSDAADQIHRLWHEKNLPNFTGLAIAPDNSKVILYWKGPLPPEMAVLVAKLRANVAIEVVDRPYSLSEFQRESIRLVQLDPAAVGFNVTGAGPLPDFSGLEVGVESAEQLDRAREVIQSPMRLEFRVTPKVVSLVGRSCGYPAIGPLTGECPLGYLDYAIIGAFGLVTLASVWFVTGKFLSRGNKTGSTGGHLPAR